MNSLVSELVSIAVQHGLSMTEGQWSKAYVYWFDAPMPNAVRSAAKATTQLEYVRPARSPHTPATEGYIDPAEQVAISFLTETD